MPDLKRLIRMADKPPAFLNLAFLVLSAVLVVALDGYFKIKLTEPAHLTGDHLFTVTAAKSYINGHGFRFDSQLGFPGARDWLYFPSFDLTYRLVLWLFARVTDNPFLVVHLFYITGLSAMGMAYYWTLRRLGISAWLSVIGGLAAIITPYFQGRIYGHDDLAMSFSVPLGFGLALLIGQDAATGRLKTFLTDPFVLVAMVVVGTSGLYYAFYTVMLALFVGVAAAIGDRRIYPVLAALVVTGVVFVLLVFSGYGFDLPLVLSGRFSQPHRLPYEQLLYGLDFVTSALQLKFIPKVAVGVDQAAQALPYLFGGESGAWPGLPLTATILATPMIAAVGQRWLTTVTGPSAPRVRMVVLCSITLLFAMLFAARGGIGFLFNLLITPEIRADERIMPFLCFGGAVILCQLAEMSRDSDHRWVRYAGPVLLSLMMLASAPKYLNGSYRWQSAYLARPDIQALQVSVKAMLAAKDRANLQTVLELPAFSWPEAPPPPTDYNPYEHQLPYVFDQPHSTTRWSYGVSDLQPAFTQVNFQTNKPQDIAARARRLGFDGVLLEKKAYAPDQSAAFKAALDAQTAPACHLYEDDLVALYALNRAPGGGTC